MNDRNTRQSRVERERDLLLRLLEVCHLNSPTAVLNSALTLARSVSGADHGYIEIYSDTSPVPIWYASQDVADAHFPTVRARVSRGIISEAIASGRTIQTPSALLDDRFSELASVRDKQICAVFCTPIGPDPVRGVIYLESVERGAFKDVDVELLELLAQQIAPLVDRLLSEKTSGAGQDPTQQWRQRISAQGLVGRAPALASVLQRVALVAPLDVSVLLLGPSGTGKTQLARVIHDSSPRAKLPFVELNCSALPLELVESELFGALPGSHSTAHRGQVGKVEAAAGGTLFLDEVAELPLKAQAKLLQLLQSGTYFPLGAPSSRQAKVRVVAASNVELMAKVEAKLFREDLFYRLNVFPIRVPSLAERREDIALLVEHFIELFAQRQGLPRLPLSMGARVALEIPEWSGNVRELENVVLRSLILAAGERAAVIEPRHLFPEVATKAQDQHLSFHTATRRFQRDLLDQVLHELDWNVAAAAERLELARSHVYSLIKTHALTRR